MSQPQRTAGPTPARRRAWPHRLVALTLVLSGGALSGWPVAETFANNQRATGAVTAYADAVAAAAASDPAPLRADLAGARDYNADLTPAALADPWSDDTPADSPAHDAYLRHLDAFDAMGRVRIPQIDVDLPIYHDATKEPLSRGVGHMYGTSLPVGGPGTHAVLAAHTGSSRRTFFDRLPEVQRGQTFYLDVHGTTLTYRVDRIAVVEPWELEAIQPVPGADLVTLVTCYQPPGEHNQRLLVRGVRVPDAAGAPGPGATGQDAAAGTQDAAASGQQDADAGTRAAAGAGAGQGAAPAASGLEPERPQDATALPATVPAAPVPVTVDTSVQSWMVPRLAGTGGAAALAVLMSVSWVVGDRRRAASEPNRRGTRAAASEPNVTAENQPRTPVEVR